MAKSPLISKMDTQQLIFKENVDAWIKQINGELAESKDISFIVEENVGNIQHNYELIYELKSQIEELRQEINALKLLQIISLKQKV